MGIFGKTIMEYDLDLISKTEPYAHQNDAMNKLYDSKIAALFMEQGTGKTKVAIDKSVNLYGEEVIDAILLVAPNSVHEQWAREQVPVHAEGEFALWVWHSAQVGRKWYASDFKKFTASSKLKILCVNVETFSGENYIKTMLQFVCNNRTHMIVDESTVIKSPSAKRTKNIIKIGKMAKYRSILTGTPVTNSPLDLWAQFEFLQENFFGCNYFIFQHRFCIQIADTNLRTGQKFKRMIQPWEIDIVRSKLNNGYFPDEVAAITNVSERNVLYIRDHPNLKSPYKNLDKLKAMIEPVTFIVKKEDCLDLPPKIYEPIYCEMNPEQKKAYTRLKNDYFYKYAGKELTVLNKCNLIMRLQQVAGGFMPHDIDPDNEETDGKTTPLGTKNPKIQRLLSDLSETGDERVIVWAHFTAEIRAITETLKKEYPHERVESYFGATAKRSRNEIIQSFKDGGIKFLVANPASAGVGLNLQRSNLHYYFSNNFSLEKRLQSEDRSHRIGQQWPVVYKDIVIKGTVDEQVADALRNKKNLLEYFRDKSLKELIT